MHSAARAATKAEMRRFMAMTELGCLACWLELGVSRPADVHHLLHGGRRIGHAATIALCEWHHRGVLADGHDGVDMLAKLGPSLARNPRRFKERYGSDADLLELQNAALADGADVPALVGAYRRSRGWNASGAA